MTKQNRGFVPAMDMVSTVFIACSWVLVWLLWPAVPSGVARPSGGESLAYTEIKYTPELSSETLLVSPIETFLIASELEREQFQGEEALELMRNRRFPFPEMLLDSSSSPASPGPSRDVAAVSARVSGELSGQDPQGERRFRVENVAVDTGLMVSQTRQLEAEAFTLPKIPEGIELTGSWSVNIFVEFSGGLDHPSLVTVDSSTAPPDVLRALVRLTRLATVTNPSEDVKGVVVFSNRQAAAPPVAQPVTPKETVNEN